jgi:CRISPR-associated endonuclease Csy4
MLGSDAMGTHYVDIKLAPDPEFGQAFLLGALYTKLHRALVQMGETGIGVGFPHYSTQPRTLGGTMRLFGSENSLELLLSTDWLRGMRDHTVLSPLAVIPSLVQHRRLIRRQFKTNVDRLRRRRMLRKGETYNQSVIAIPSEVERQPGLPYIHVRSSSTGQTFCLFLFLGTPEPQQIDGVFNSYGLSRTATLPWF